MRADTGYPRIRDAYGDPQVVCARIIHSVELTEASPQVSGRWRFAGVADRGILAFPERDTLTPGQPHSHGRRARRTIEKGSPHGGNNGS